MQTEFRVGWGTLDPSGLFQARRRSAISLADGRMASRALRAEGSRMAARPRISMCSIITPVQADGRSWSALPITVAHPAVAQRGTAPSSEFSFAAGKIISGGPLDEKVAAGRPSGRSPSCRNVEAVTAAVAPVQALK